MGIQFAFHRGTQIKIDKMRHVRIGIFLLLQDLLLQFLPFTEGIHVQAILALENKVGDDQLVFTIVFKPLTKLRRNAQSALAVDGVIVSAAKHKIGPNNDPSWGFLPQWQVTGPLYNFTEETVNE